MNYSLTYAEIVVTMYGVQGETREQNCWAPYLGATDAGLQASPSGGF